MRVVTNSPAATTSPPTSTAGASHGSQFGVEFFAGWLTEYSLSVDNLFIFLIIMASFNVPRKYQQEALLIGIISFAFLLGLGRGYSTQTAHDFFKFVLGITTFWLVIQLVSTIADAHVLLLLVIGGIACSATIGLALYVGGASLTAEEFAAICRFPSAP